MIRAISAANMLQTNFSLEASEDGYEVAVVTLNVRLRCNACHVAVIHHQSGYIVKWDFSSGQKMNNVGISFHMVILV